MPILISKIIPVREIRFSTKNLYVELWDKDVSRDHLLGAAFTDAEGNFSITYEEQASVPTPRPVETQVYVKIYQDEELIKNTVEQAVPIIRNTIPHVIINLRQDVRRPTNAVRGAIQTPAGRGIPNLIVRAFNKSSRAEVFLSEAITNQKGEYAIYYPAGVDTIRRSASHIDLLVKAFKEPSEEVPVITSPLIINALPREIINLSVGDEKYQGLDSYTSIHETLEDSINLSNLRNLSEREVFILANTHDLDVEAVSHYIQSRQWKEWWDGLPPEVYFGWFRTGLPNDWAALLQIPIEQLTAALDEAIEKNYIPASTGTIREGLEKLIAQWRTDNLVTAKGERIERGSMGELLGTSRLTVDQRKQLFDDWQNFEGGIDEYWERQKKNVGEENYKDLELTLQLGAVTRNHLPLIQSVKNKSRLTRIQELAILKEEDWLSLMEEDKLEVPVDIPGDDLQAKRREFATQLRSITEEIVPTAVLARSFKDDKDINSDTLDRFMERNPEFEFRNKTVKAFLKENPEALGDVDDKALAQKELEAVQRVFHLTPTKEKHRGAKILWQNGLHSAYAIKMEGLSSLQELFAGNEELAERIYSNASMKQSQASMVKMQMHSLYTPIYAIAPGISGLIQSLDGDADLEALFGDQGYCKCKHCDSFFSPSAYLVDLFLYLKKVKVNARSANPDLDTALEKLFKRRPDLGNIQLDCENSHTPLPYIDLVNEVMEMAIVPISFQNTQVNIYGKMFALPVAKVPQTENDSASLKAYPQHVRQEVYDLLHTGTNEQTIGFPWILPFNLWMLEVRTYLNHLGVPRAELMASILGGAINGENIAAEYVNILPEEMAIFNDTTFSAATTLRFWGANVAQLEKVTIYLQQTGYSYEKLTELLSMRYIQPANSIVFQPISSCLLSDATIPGLTDELLSRMHKFGRLLLKTNEDMHSLDRTIMAFGGEINSEFLLQYTDLLRVKEILKTKIDRKEILSWWVSLDASDYKGDPSLYTRLFMLPNKIEAFKLNDSKDELLNPGTILDPMQAPLDPDLLAPILSAIKLKARDLELLVAEEFPGQVITLGLSQISYLYRTASFCRVMKLKIAEYLALKKIFGFQPVSGINVIVSPAQTIAFIEKYHTIKNAGFDAEELNYILRHQFRPNAPFVITHDEIGKVLKQLQAAILVQLKEVFPAGITTREKVNTKLKMIIGTNEPEAVEKVLAIENVIAGTSSLSVPEQEALIDDQMIFFTNKQDAKDQLINGALDTEARFLYVLNALNDYLLENSIVQDLSTSLAIAPHFMMPLLQQLLLHPSSPTANAFEVFLEEIFINADPKMLWTALEFNNQFILVTRLHKIKLLIDGLKLKLRDLMFLMAPASVVTGFPDFNLLPVQESAVVEGADHWIAVMNLAILNKDFFTEEISVFDVLNLIQNNSFTREALLQQIKEITGWKTEDLLYLTGAGGLNLTFPQDYTNGEWLIKIGITLKLVDRVGATARQMSGWTTPNITKTQADSVRYAAMAKYGEKQWQEITVPLRHNIREAQRDALVQYVLHYVKKHTGSKFDDIDDIYGYYLIDTQMAACTDTSRIVLASSSVQLFVQRIMMNLEPAMSLNREFIKEWKWRKYYRVWEANRKVFMWPENWIEPELRDDKTPLFKELENDLMQGELTSENVETAYVNYLEKLHEIAHLKVVGMYQDTDALHVIAHTSGSPEKYYYRRWENRSQWTAWEKIELDIFNGEQIEDGPRGILITPVVHNRRLFLFWPIFKFKKEPPSELDEIAIEAIKVNIDTLNSEIRGLDREINKMSREIDILKDRAARIENIDENFDFVNLEGLVSNLKDLIVSLEDAIGDRLTVITQKKTAIRTKEEEIRDLEEGYMRYKITMAWSQYRNGFWTPKKISQKEIRTQVFIDDFKKGASIEKYMVLPEKTPEESLNLHILFTKVKKVYKLNKYFQFNDCKSEVDTMPLNLVNWGAYEQQFDLKTPMLFMKGFMESKSTLKIVPGGGNEILLLEKTLNFSNRIKTYQSDLYKTQHPFFYEDPSHCFFISPPSINQIQFKSASFAKTSMLRSGTNILQESSYRLLPGKKDPAESRSSVQFANSHTASFSFFESGNANQIIVRDKSKRGVMSNSSFSFGKAPAQNGAALNSAVSKMAFEINGYRFYPFYHPYTCLFLKQLNRYGIEGLLNPDASTKDGKELLHQATPSHMTVQQFKDKYKPNLSEVNWSDVKEEIDFKHGGVYATYNWELFYHIPLFVATRLSQDQRFDEAQNWFHYIFDPTETEGNIPYRFWKIKPFHTYTITEMKKDMEAVMKGGEEIKKQVQAWEDNPFNPHMLARFRRLAYMKTVVMKYLDNLIAWGDQLFRMDSIESMNEATQLYVLAGQILGKLPVETEAKPRESKSFNELAAHLTEMGNAWVNLENAMTNDYEFYSADYSMGYSSARETKMLHRDSVVKKPSRGKIKSIGKIKSVGNGATISILDDILYFCMSPNEKLLSYWDTVADRLFKLRNCMNIEGLIRSVPLFQPPIDPALLVKAVAAGVDISSAINDLYAPMPYYRFRVLIQKAQGLCQELKSLGNSLLSTLEKKDAEKISLLRSQHEIQLLEANKEIKKQQMEEARLSVLSLEESYKLASIRYDNYSDRDFMNPAEIVAMVMSTGATVMQVIAAATASGAAVAAQVPDIEISTHAQGMSSGASVKIHTPGSGSKNKDTAMSISRVFDILSIISRDLSNNISTAAGYERRMEDWNLQIELAEQEMKQINKQILGALVRKEIAEKERENLDLQIENARLTDAYMRSKYTNQELYNWLIGQITTVYFQTYKMAYDMAKQAEKAFRFELGIETSNYIQFGYWDNLRKGLLSGEKLQQDLNRLDLAYLEKDKRDYEIIKHVSLSQLDPLALIRFRATGISEFEIPEVLYDMDHPGQYFRRLKSASISIPCIAGPYTSVSARLSLTKSRYRKNTNLTGSYTEELNNDERFIYNLGAIQSIATSKAQNDSGIFDLNFRDERFLPFEGTGAISNWHLEMPGETRQFDYNTIADVIIHVKYTAREGGSLMKSAASEALKEQLAVIKQGLSQDGLHFAVNMRHDLPNEWHLLKQNGTIDILLDKSRLPYMAQLFETEIDSVLFLARAENSFALSVDGVAINLAPEPALQLHRGLSSEIQQGTTFNLSIAPADKDKLEDLMMVIKYKF